MPLKEPANIVVLFCDQLQRNVLRLHGGNLVNTPNLDSLAADGTVFDEAYTPTAICSPARASLMTGLYPHTHHMFNNSTPGYSFCLHLRPEVQMVQDVAAAQTSYETAYFGKWHIGPAEDLFASSFDHTVAPDADRLPFMRGSHWHSKGGLGELTTPMCAGEAGLYDGPLETYPDVVAAQYSIDFLERRDRSRPFLLFCAFPGPHSPWMLPEKWGLRHQPDEIELPANRHDTFRDKPINQRKLRLFQASKQGLSHYADDERNLREAWACMTSSIELIDHEVGRVVEALKSAGLYDETLIVFTSDHGDMAGAHGFLSKGSYMYDEIYRIPLIVKPPAGIAAPARIKQAPVNLTDLTATFLHVMTGSEQATLGSETLHGRSLLPLLEGAPWERAVHYAEYHGDWYGHYSARMVTDGHWKLVWNLSDLSELYDLDNDPLELTNRFMDPACQPQRERLFALLREEARRLGDGQVRLHIPEVELQLWEG